MASLFERVVWWLRPPRVQRTPPLWSALRARGASRELIRWAEPFGYDLEGAWRACPRPDWVIEIAVRAGVSGARIVGALSELEVAATVIEAAEGVSRAAVEPEVFLETVSAATSALVEALPAVGQAQAAYERAGRGEHLAALQAFEAAYERAQQELADVARRRISSEEVRVALEGLGAHPYR